jgi:hypothetical protein
MHVSIALIINRNTENEMPESSRRSIGQYYADFPEEERLRSGMGRLEFENEKDMERFMPSPPAVVLDVGGARDRIHFGWQNWVMKRTLSTDQSGW